MKESKNAPVQSSAIEVQEIEKATLPLVNEIETFKIVSSQDYEQGQKYLKVLSNLEKLRKAKEDVALIPAKETLEAIKEIYRPAKERISECVTIVKEVMGSWVRAEQARQEKERQRILSDSRTKVETKESKLQAVIEAPRAGTRKIKVLKVTDVNHIPREFFDVNETRLKAWLLEGNTCKGASIETETIITC